MLAAAMSENQIEPKQLEQLASLLRPAKQVLVFSGAGMSAESGIATFRGAPGSLWSEFNPAELASPEGWRADPDLVWGWYVWRMNQVRAAQPHAGYAALAKWQARQPELAVVTQNVDDLHQRAGISKIIHLHGELFAHRCFACGRPHPDLPLPQSDGQRRIPPARCQGCGGLVRPGVVWFGESLPQQAWRQAQELASECDLMLVVGTSALVQPAAMLPDLAAQAGAKLVEINPEASALSARVDLHLRCSAVAGLAACLGVLD